MKADDKKGFTDQWRSDLKAIMDQSIAPISMIITELRHVDFLVNIGRFFLAPALLTAMLVVFISSPLISLWNYYAPHRTQDNVLESRKEKDISDATEIDIKQSKEQDSTETPRKNRKSGP